MRKILKRSLAVLLIAMLVVPVMWNQDIMSAMAAVSPSFSEKTISINGIGETHQLLVKNKVANSRYVWSSSNKAVAKVSQKGWITSVSTGTANIKCKITYPTKKTKTLSCKVSVVIPATAVAISDLTLKNHAYQLAIGGTVDLNAVITPVNSTDKAYWYIDADNELSDPSCITLDANNQGIVTGVKAGKAVVRVKAVANAADTTTIEDSIIIEVVKPTASVSSMQITNSNEMQIVFDNPIQKDTVITSSGTLSSNITITMGKDKKGVAANDPGKLTANLSTDLKTLTITTANTLKGSYGIDVSGSVKTTDGVAVDPDYQYIEYIDTVPPVLTGVTIDDTGVIATITFSEPMDFTNLKVSDTKCLSSTAFSATSIAVISNKSNYIVSTDKKSLTVNLSTIPTPDFGKVFTTVLSGITDTAGNYPASAYIQVSLQTASSQMPQAQPYSVIRTGYYTLTANFDRSIKMPGILRIGNGSTYTGVVDPNNMKQVNYTISATDALLSGNITVYLSGYNSYNVIATDTSAYTPHTLNCFFTTDTVSPVLVANDYNPETSELTLTYSEPVVLAAATGVLPSTLTTLAEDVRAVNVNYTQVTNKDDNKIVLKLSNIATAGIYTITIPSGFITDNFRNPCAAGTIQISNLGNSTSNELPAPFNIAPSSTNLNQVYVYFANKLDKVSAETVSNYAITGVKIISASLTENTPTGAIVLLTLADSSVDVTVARPITISGIKGYNNSYSAISSYSSTVTLTENTKPYIITTTYDRSSNRVVMTFNEAIKGTMVVNVTNSYAGASTVITNTVSVNGNSVYVTLGSVPANGSYLYLAITNNSITDSTGNASVTINGVNATVSY